MCFHRVGFRVLSLLLSHFEQSNMFEFSLFVDVNLEIYMHVVPVELCLSFSFFFFLHFQGLKMRPRVASLLLRRMGGVWTPLTRQPVRSTLCWSTNSTAVDSGDGRWGRSPGEGWELFQEEWNWVREEWARVWSGENEGNECEGFRVEGGSQRSRWEETGGGGGETKQSTISMPTLLNKPWWTPSAVNRLN